MKKKISGLVLVAILVFTAVVLFGMSKVYAFTDEEKFLMNNDRSLELHSEVIDLFRVDSMTRFSDDGINFNYKDDFAGTFIDELGHLNIGVVNQNHSRHVRDAILLFPEVNFIPKLHSFNYLLEIHDVLAHHMRNLEIESITLNERENQVDVVLHDDINVSKTVDVLEMYGLFCETAVNIVVDLQAELVNNSTAIFGGESVFSRVNPHDTTGIRGTLTIAAINNNNGQIGMLTNEHVALTSQRRHLSYCGHFNVNTQQFSHNVYMNVGAPGMGQNSGSIDAAFIPFLDQNNWNVTPHARYHNTTFDNIRLGNESQIVSGQVIMRIGQTTGITHGKIDSRLQTNRLTSTFTYDNVGQSGDSGGPVFANISGTYFLIGMHFGTRSGLFIPTRGVACRITEVMRILNVTPITNDIYQTTTIGSEIRINSVNIGQRGRLTIPQSMFGRNVTEIGPQAFEGRIFTQLTLPSTLRVIGANAFANNLALSGTINIPSNVNWVGPFAFSRIGNNAILNIQGKTTVPNSWHPDWNPSGRQVRFNGSTFSHQFTIINGVRRCSRSQTRGVLSLNDPVILNGRQVINTNNTPVNVWFKWESSTDNDWVYDIIYSNLMPNAVANVDLSLLHRGGGELWFEVVGVTSNSVWISDTRPNVPINLLAPLQVVPSSLLNRSHHWVTVWLSFDSWGEDDGYSFILRQSLGPNHAIIIPSAYIGAHGSVNVWFVHGGVQSSMTQIH